MASSEGTATIVSRVNRPTVLGGRVNGSENSNHP